MQRNLRYPPESKLLVNVKQANDLPVVFVNDKVIAVVTGSDIYLITKRKYLGYSVLLLYSGVDLVAAQAILCNLVPPAHNDIAGLIFYILPQPIAEEVAEHVSWQTYGELPKKVLRD